ncbi:MAG: hypothetical protein ACYC0T_07000 [Ramlibacter sp.]
MGGIVPYDKRYAELTPEQQAAVKALYEQIGPDDEPPFPADGLASIYKAIVAAQQKLQVTGSLTLAVQVNPQACLQRRPLKIARDKRGTRPVARRASSRSPSRISPAVLRATGGKLTLDRRLPCSSLSSASLKKTAVGWRR